MKTCKTFSLTSKVNDGQNNITFNYKDGDGKPVVFVETNKAFGYVYKLAETHEDYRNNKIFKKLIEGYIDNSINRSQFKNYEDAISRVTITI